jgi:hypothetical protein
MLAGNIYLWKTASCLTAGVKTLRQTQVLRVLFWVEENLKEAGIRPWLVFNDDAAFHLRGKVNLQSVHVLHKQQQQQQQHEI